MALKTDRRKIRDVELITSSIPVIEASIVWFRLGKLLAPAMATMRSMSAADKVRLVAALSSLAEKPEELTIAGFGDLVGLLGPAFAEIFSKADLRELPDLYRGLFASTIAIRDGVKYELMRGLDQVNAAFDGDEGGMLLAALWIARHNFETFGFGRRAKNVETSTAASQST